MVHFHFRTERAKRERKLMVSGTTAAVIGATVIGAGLSLSAAVASGAFSRKKSGSPSAPSIDKRTGALTEDEARAAAKKRVFRAGIIATSPTGLGGDESLATTKLR